MSTHKSVSINLGFATPLALIFITLKLCGIIHWSWLWVLAPIWIPLGLFVIFAIAVGLLFLGAKLLDRRIRKYGNGRKY